MAERQAREWELVYTDWDPGEQPLREALCALGNGRIVTRGAFEEVRSGGPHCPGTYLAGGYNRLETEIAGRVVENEDLVNWPNWLPPHVPSGGRRLVRLDTGGAARLRVSAWTSTAAFSSGPSTSGMHGP
jgi:trehalose/maltose hydrolase-like predicted phosphorylase